MTTTTAARIRPPAPSPRHEPCTCDDGTRRKPHTRAEREPCPDCGGSGWVEIPTVVERDV